MENFMLIYKVKVTDELGRYFEANGRAEAKYLIIKEQSDVIYQQMMETFAANILWRMGTEVSAEWIVELTEEDIDTIDITT